MVSVNMDASPVQSSSKCNSDFSIERLLSDDTKRRDENVEVPDWLCCTRYRPPRLPRAATVCRVRRAGRHARVPFTAAQASALEAAYARAPYLAPPALRALAAALQLRDDRIKIWFQNRRARERREKSVNINPPNAITLPPTTLGSFPTLPPNSWITRPSRISEVNTPIATQSIETNTPPATLNSGINIFANLQGFEVNQRFLDSRNSEVFREDSGDERSDGHLDIETVD